MDYYGYNPYGNQNELAHYGVKGMKWGKRKAKELYRVVFKKKGIKDVARRQMVGNEKLGKRFGVRVFKGGSLITDRVSRIGRLGSTGRKNRNVKQAYQRMFDRTAQDPNATRVDSYGRAAKINNGGANRNANFSNRMAIAGHTIRVIANDRFHDMGEEQTERRSRRRYKRGN